MSAAQQHGFDFEKYIMENKLNEIIKLHKKDIPYTYEFDIPPIQIKSFNYSKKVIEFGSLKNKINQNSDYVLVLIGYEQVGEIKKVVFSNSFYIPSKISTKIKGNLNLNYINDLENKIKSFERGKHTAARNWAKQERKTVKNFESLYDVRFKIDSKIQRRIQCSLKLDTFFDFFEVNQITNHLKIPSINSPSRKFKKKTEILEEVNAA